MRRTYRQGDRGNAIQQQQRSARRDMSSQQQRAQRDQQLRVQQGQQQTYFRGPQSDQFQGRDRDRDVSREFQRERSVLSDRDTRDSFDTRFRDQVRDRDRDLDARRDVDGRDADWRNRVFDDNRRLDQRFDDRRFDNRDFDGRNVDRRRLNFRRDDWSQTANRIRDDWRRRDRDDLPFRFGWWDDQRVARWPVVSPWRYDRWRDRPYYWWSWTAAPRLTDWLVFSWRQPYYWDYGPGGNIYYQNDYVYYDNQRYLADDQYYRQVHDLAHSVPSIDTSEAERMDWRPLGVFAATRGSEAAHRTMQLAVNKDGVLSGTYYNPQSEHVHPLLGMVDDNTQRAAWAFADGEHPDVVFETSIYNLTEPESTMMVHFGPRAADAEVWRLVRLERPEASESELPAPQSTTTRDLP